MDERAKPRYRFALRLSQTEVGAYTNVCPHAGANNEWELRMEIFLDVTGMAIAIQQIVILD